MLVQEPPRAMAATSSATAFAADDVDAEVTECPPVVAGSIKLPAE
jgi:hypothetical protein